MARQNGFFVTGGKPARATRDRPRLSRPHGKPPSWRLTETCVNGGRPRSSTCLLSLARNFNQPGDCTSVRCAANRERFSILSWLRRLLDRRRASRRLSRCCCQVGSCLFRGMRLQEFRKFRIFARIIRNRNKMSCSCFRNIFLRPFFRFLKSGLLGLALRFF